MRERAEHGRSLLPTLKPIQGYTTKDASDAFTKYEGVRCQIIPGDDVTTLVTTFLATTYQTELRELAGSAYFVPANLVGIGVAMVWNFLANVIWTWG